MLLPLFALLLPSLGEATDASRLSTQNRLVNKVLESYDRKVKPTRLAEDAVTVSFSMELYQIIDVNEPHQFVLVNAWIVERWRDEFLYWDPTEFDGIGEIMLPHDEIWLPDTTLYNTLIMKAEDARRLMNVKLVTNSTDKSVNIELLYPTIYKFSCLLNIYYFPFDSQICKMTFGSWTYDKSGIDYVPHSDDVGTSNYLENEGWIIKSFKAKRREIKYVCCPNNYTNLIFTLHIKRKPLFYIVNLIIPTCIITLISVVGFFSPSSASGDRNEKISLGITTLLSMSILLLMISDQMPTTSTFIPLIGWFLLSMIIVISMSTIMSSVVIMVQKMGLQGERLPTRVVRIAYRLSRLIYTRIPNHLNGFDLCDSSGDDDGSSKVARKNRNQEKKTGKNSSEVELLRRESSHYVPPSFQSAAKLLHHFSKNSADMNVPYMCPYVKWADSDSSTPEPQPEKNLIGKGNDVPKSVEVESGGDTVSNKLSAFKAAVLKQRKMSLANEKTSRALVSREYEWLATVIERCSFIVFFALFILLSFGINGIGLIQWLKT